MKRKRINFDKMTFDEFIDYLTNRDIEYKQLNTTTPLGLGVVKVSPINNRMVSRLFEKASGIQLDPRTELTGIDITKKNNVNRLIKIVDDKINNMATKGVYHPRRLQPKWQSLKTNKEKLELFRRYMSAPNSSIGFLRLINCDLPAKTLESIIIEHPQYEDLIGVKDLRQKCIDKFEQYQNGKTYLKSLGIQ